MKNEEKQLLEKLYIFIEEDDVDNILKTLGRLNSEYPNNERYWYHHIKFIIDNIELFEEDQKESILLRAVNLCNKYRNQSSSFRKSNFYVLEYYCMVELMNINPLKYQSLPFEEIAQNAVKSDANNPDAYHIWGNYYSANELRDEAEINYEKSFQQRGGKYNLLLAIDRAANNDLNKNYIQAIKDYELILSKDEKGIYIKAIYKSLVNIYKELKDDNKEKHYQDLLSKL